MAASTDGIYRFLSQEMFFLKEVKQRHSGFLPLLMGLFLLGLVFPAMADNTIQGTVSLPVGDVAQVGGQHFTVNAEDITSGNSTVVKTVTIAEGQSSTAYSLSVPSDASASWQISYDCGLLCDSYVRVGYYSNTTTTWDKSAATILPGGADHSGIDMTLLTGDTISGQIFLPQGDVAPNGGLWVSLFLRDSTVGFYFGRVKIEEGDASVAYKRVIPSLASANWSVNYMCTGSACDPYYTFGWYSSSGTVWNSLDATMLPGSSDYNNIDLTLLRADHFSGRLFLPVGEVAPAGGMRFDINISDVHTNNQFLKMFTVPAGYASVSYDMVVPYIPMAEWTAAYLCNSAACQSYVLKAYYLDGGMTLDESQATVFPSGTNYSQIDLRVAMNLSSSCTQSNETITGPLIYSGDYFCSADASITAGQNSVVVGNNAYVVYAAPSISLVSGFAIADHGIFRAGKNLLP
jgi:hypothetical protein